MIELLYGTAAAYGELRIAVVQRLHSCGEESKGTRDTTDLIVNGRRTVDRNDHLVRQAEQGVRESRQQQSGGENGDLQPCFFENFAQLRQLRVHERLASCQHYGLDV